MPISNSDIITSQIIREELGLDPGTPFAIGDSNVRELLGIASGSVNIPNDFKGKGKEELIANGVLSSAAFVYGVTNMGYYPTLMGSVTSSFFGSEIGAMYSTHDGTRLTQFRLRLTNATPPPNDFFKELKLAGKTLKSADAAYTRPNATTSEWRWTANIPVLSDGTNYPWTLS